MSDNEYIDWYSVKDPHPAAMPNLNALVSYMVAKGHIHNQAPVSAYRLAKDLDKHPKQIASLIKGRPGFVQITRDGNSLGYYWDKGTFGGFYPQTLAGHRGRKLLAVEEVTVQEKAVVKALNANIEDMAKAVAKKSQVPDVSLDAYSNAERSMILVEYSRVPFENAPTLLREAVKEVEANGLNDGLGQDILTGLLSILAHNKDIRG